MLFGIQIVPWKIKWGAGVRGDHFLGYFPDFDTITRLNIITSLKIYW